MEKVYPDSYLDKLLPMKTFYEKRGISARDTRASLNAVMLAVAKCIVGLFSLFII
jgi:hypothetical protein